MPMELNTLTGKPQERAVFQMVRRPAKRRGKYRGQNERQESLSRLLNAALGGSRTIFDNRSADGEREYIPVEGREVVCC